MKTNLKIKFQNIHTAHWFVWAFVILFLGFLPFFELKATVNPLNILTYQGRLLDANQIPISDSSVQMKFFLYTAITGGTCVWSNSSSTCHTNTPSSTSARSVSLTNGLFSEDLGDTNASTPYTSILSSVFADYADIYLEIEIAGETLSPRKRLTSAAYAVNAQTLDGFDSTSFLADTGDIASGNYDFTEVGFTGVYPFKFEGNTVNDFETTFSITDPTADRTVTFKDASGTVAYLSDLDALDNWVDTSGDTMTGTLILPSSGLQIGSSVPFSDASGTLTIQNIDAIDSITESTIESVIDSLSNLTSIQNQNITLSGSLTVSGNATLNQDVSSTSSPTFLGLTLGADTVTDLTGTGLTVVGGSLQTTLGTSIDLTSEVTSTLAVTNGGTGLTSVSVGDLIYGSASNTLSTLTGPTTANQILRSSASNTFAWGSLTTSDLPSDGYASTYVNTSGDTMTGTLAFGTGVSELAIFNGEDLDFTDGTNSLLTITDNGSTATLSVNAASVSTLTVDSSVLDVNSLDFVGVGTITSSGISSDLSLTAGRDLLLDDDNLTTAVPLAVADSALNGALTQGIIDAINDVYDVALAGGSGSLFTDGGAITYLTSTSDDLAIGGSALASSFSINVDENEIRIGDAISDANDPTIHFYASDASSEGTLEFTDNDRWYFNGGDLFVGASTASGVHTSFSANGDDIFTTGDIAAQDNMYADTFVAGDSSTTLANGSLTNTDSDLTIVLNGNNANDRTLYLTANNASGGGYIEAVAKTSVSVSATNGNIGLSASANLTLDSSNGDVYFNDIRTDDIPLSLTDTNLNNFASGDRAIIDALNYLYNNIGGTGLWTDGGDITSLVSITDDLALGGSDSTSSINFDVSADTIFIGDTTDDVTDPTITFRASDGGTNSGSLSFLDTDDFLFTGGDITFAQTTTIGDGGDRITIDSDGTLSISDTSIVFTGAGTISSTGADLLFSDDNATAIPLTVSDTDLSSFDAADRGIIDALNYLYANIGGGGGSSLFTDGGTVTYLTSTSDDLAIGGSALASPFSINVDENEIRIGDAISDANDPTIHFYASDASSEGTLEFTDNDLWYFNGGDLFIGSATSTMGGADGIEQIISSTPVFNANGDDLFILGELGVKDTAYFDTGIIVDGSFSPDQLSILNSGLATSTNLVALFEETPDDTLSAARQDVGTYTYIDSGVNAGTKGYRVYGDALEVRFTGTASSNTNIIGRVTQAALNNVTGTVSTLTVDHLSIGQNNFANNSTVTTANFINAEYKTVGSLSVTNFRGLNLDVEDGSSTITDARGINIAFDQTVGSGSITTAYGVYISENNATTAWSFYGAEGAGDAAFLDDVFIGATSESISDIGFTMSGDDAYVHGMLGVNGWLYADSGLTVLGDSSVSFIGSFFNSGNNDNRQGVSIQACADTNPSGSCNFLELRDGDGTVLGAIEGNGAGGVTNASTGSDYAELFSGNYTDFSAGDVLALDENGNIERANQANKILGAFSVSPNVLGNWFDNWQQAGTHVPVALLGQVPVNVNNEGGNISPGDYLTISSIAGVVKKATGVGFMLGRALESFSGTNGTIQVYIQPTWQALDIVINENGTTSFKDEVRLSSQSATRENPTLNSPYLSLRGSSWQEAEDTTQGIQMSFFTSVTNTEDYHLSLRNNADTEVVYITSNGTLKVAGDAIVTGRLYPSDKGTAQTEKYIYYDGDDGLGGDFMRTNASGWATGSYDFAEMFPSFQKLEPGDVVIFANIKETVERSQSPYSKKIAGIISTRPGFLAGENKPGEYPVALAGRVPTKVSLENGPIEIGDPLTTSSQTGFAMKATESGSIIGYALEPYDGGAEKILVFVNVGHYEVPVTVSDQPIPSSYNSSSNFSSLDLTGTLYMHGNLISDIGALSGLENKWEIKEDGTVSTHALLNMVIKSYQGEEVETTAVASPEVFISLSGTTTLENGQAIVSFEEVYPEFNDIISTVAPIRVFVTPNAPVSLYVSEKNHNGFSVQAISENTNGVEVDWMVQAYRKDYEPEKYLELQTEKTDTDTGTEVLLEDSSTKDSSIEEKTNEQDLQEQDQIEETANTVEQIISETKNEVEPQEIQEQVSEETVQIDEPTPSVSSEDEIKDPSVESQQKDLSFLGNSSE